MTKPTLLHKATEDMPFNFYQPEEVFKQCIEQGHDWVKEYMYMHSNNQFEHSFKHPVTRQYKTVALEQD